MPVFQLSNDLVFPPPQLARSDGLLAVGGDLSEARLLLAYRLGIFPWFGPEQPILWWSPDPRLVIFPQDFRPSHRLLRLARQEIFQVTFDRAFEGVIGACATVHTHRHQGTWITPEMAAAYCRLHESGFGHSVEVWRGSELVGGLYGVTLGRAFFGESMFFTMANASKIALLALVEILAAWNFSLIDCQVTTDHLLRMGAVEIPRQRFLALLARAVAAPTRRGKWDEDPQGWPKRGQFMKQQPSFT